MKRLIVTAALLIAAIGFTVAPATAAAPEGNIILCFDGTADTRTYYSKQDPPSYYGGTCTRVSSTQVVLKTNGGFAGGEYAGVYIQNGFAVGTLVSSITKWGFSYAGTAVGGGAPRITVGIDEDGDGSGIDGYAAAQALFCNENDGKVDVINDATCMIEYNGGTYENWAAFKVAFPAATVAYQSFIIADAPGEWTISNVQLGAKSRGGE